MATVLTGVGGLLLAVLVVTFVSATINDSAKQTTTLATIGLLLLLSAVFGYMVYY